MLMTILFSVILVSLAVLVHFEALRRLWVIEGGLSHRFRVVVTVLGTLTAHAIEIWIFAIGLYLLVLIEGTGELIGDTEGVFMDYVYFSFVTYTSLGYGDLIPTGPVRYVAGIEALVGLVMIAWTASFIFLKMQRFWEK